MFENISTETLIWIGVGYVLLCVLAYFIQEKFIFKPEKLKQDFVYKYDDLFEEIFFDPEPGVRINALRFYQEDGSSRGLLFYFHGNTRSIKGWAKYAKDFTHHGYDVLMIDYRGFGKSVGKRTEEGLKNDAQHVYNKMRSKYGYTEAKIVIYGRSLGSGFATKLASSNSPKMLILDAPYYSFTRLMNRFLPFLPTYILRFSIRTDLWIKYVKCPIYIIHGTKDLLIPFRSSVKLTNLMPQSSRLIPIYGGGHNNLPSFPEYHQHLADILLDRFDLIFDKYERRFEL